jgi:predicted nucleic acid-binding Zn ribbon protein
MIKKLKELYKEFKPYVRVDLIMYGVMILLIVLYFVISVFI